MKYKISVIIPCYNVECTIERCINSVIKQSFNFENIELIVYDDGSTDSTKHIIKNFSNKYNNIIFIDSNKNQGPGKARNEGIKLSTADYIMFMDADDEYDSQLCETFYNEINSSNSDLICCKSINMVDNVPEFDIYNDCEKVVIKKEEILYFKEIFIFNKLYKRSLLLNENILFPEHKYGEDFHFNIRYFVHCNEVIYMPHYFGYYRHVQNDSISRSWSLEDLRNLIKTYFEIFHEVSKKNFNINFDKFFDNHIEYIFFKLCTLHLLKNKSDVIKLLKELYSFEKEILFNGTFDSKVLKIANTFLLKKQFALSYYYLKFIEKLYNLDKIKMLYRKVINLRR